MQENISFNITLSTNFEDSVQIVTEALKSEGFGILTEIDVKATLKKKIDQDFHKYTIFGACNPPLAHKALQSDPQIGLFLPCNVTLEEAENGTLVNLINPKVMLLSVPSLAKNEMLIEVALDAHDRLVRVAKTLEGK